MQPATRNHREPFLFSLFCLELLESVDAVSLWLLLLSHSVAEYDPEANG